MTTSATTPPAPAPVPFARRVTRTAFGRHQSAAVRIGIAGTWLFFLLREWPNRAELYGPDGPWSFELAERLTHASGAFTVLLWSDSTWWFEACYHFGILTGAALLLGWRTRTASVLFMIGVLSLQNRSVYLGNGGDNVIHLMAVYLVLTRCGRVWSLDSRRARRVPPGTGADVTGLVLWTVLGAALAAATSGPLTPGWALLLWGLWLAQGLWWALVRYAPGEPRAVADALANGVHNAALLVIMAEVCLIYATAGWYKIQGSRWQDGTGAYFPLQVDHFKPWPALTEAVSSHALLILAMTYLTVIVQVGFPFTVFHRRLKNALLVVMIGEHLSIAVLLGLPFFSLAMIAVDVVFLPHGFFRWCENRLADARVALRRRRAAPGGGGGGADAGGGDADEDAGAAEGKAPAGTPSATAG
ncbi:HTTM domain-containing protein [Streptomyces sp. TRM 70351]|uniref:HTTM domain-containing protein n=1 Tax=Streptomyces sp. TRM 70351 TaxID=3116552 RepID=UPI002E7B0161|nr:HTTM domain-containing protein [Streptomyces sp. TRM 70351]MEE1927057.1 HTTM domain-containing protein [Streptomyces sp. TRM 70351]